MTAFHCAMVFESPIGTLGILAAHGEHLQVILPPFDTEVIPASAKWVKKGEHKLVDEACDYLKRYFKGEHVSWAGKYIPGQSGFLYQVWGATTKIPWGVTITYADLAERIGRPHAARAVGRAMAVNPLPILVPCHRVVASNGGLGGYGGGLDIKRWLLKHEGVEIGCLDAAK